MTKGIGRLRSTNQRGYIIRKHSEVLIAPQNVSDDCLTAVGKPDVFLSNSYSLISEDAPVIFTRVEVQL